MIGIIECQRTAYSRKVCVNLNLCSQQLQLDVFVIISFQGKELVMRTSLMDATTFEEVTGREFESFSMRRTRQWHLHAISILDSG